MTLAAARRTKPALPAASPYGIPVKQPSPPLGMLIPAEAGKVDQESLLGQKNVLHYVETKIFILSKGQVEALQQRIVVISV